MSDMLKRGQAVKLVQPVIEGEIVRADTNGDQFGYIVKYKAGDEEHERFFPTEQLEPI